MKITFIKNCPPIVESGNSAYKSGDQADLRMGKQLIALGYARDGWGFVMNTQPEPSTAVATTEELNATSAAIRLAEESGLDLWGLNGMGSGDDGRILVSDVRAWADG